MSKQTPNDPKEKKLIAEREQLDCDEATSTLRNQVVARSTMGDAFYLFRHQVGGHKPFLRSAPGEVCKPAIPMETKFYKSLDLDFPQLKPFVPRYISTIDVDMRVFEEKISSSYTAEKEGNEMNESDTKFTTPSKRKRKRSATPRPAEFSLRLWNKLAESTESTKDSSSPYIYEYTVLEDLTQGYIRPCVLDIKMGTRQHGIHASPAKVSSHTAKCKSTTSYELGLRLCGMQTYQTSTKQYILKDKHWGRSLTKQDIKPAFELYLSNGIGIRSDVLGKLLEKLRHLAAIIKTIESCRFWGASLLLIYEGDNHENSSSSADAGRVDVRMIDFANWHRDEQLKGPDEGYLLGLQNVVAFLEDIQEESTSQQKKHPKAADATAGYYLDVFPDE